MILNSREIVFVEYSTERNWYNEIPSKNWLCVFVSDDRDRNYLDEVIAKILVKEVLYVCAIGNQCETVHDLVDEEIVYREVEKLYLPKHEIMTTWHHDFEEGIWFSIFAANSDDAEIEKVVFIDMTRGDRLSQIKNIVKNFI